MLKKHSLAIGAVTLLLPAVIGFAAPAQAASGFVMPSLDAANIAFNLLKVVSGSVAVGPILLGAARPAHIVTPSITVRGLLNMSTIAVIDAVRRGPG